MIRICLLVVFIFILQNIQAQVVQPKRYEIELGSFDAGYEVMLGEENGVIFYKATKQYQSKSQLWEFNMLDTALNPMWQKLYYIDSDYIYSGYDYFGTDFYFLYQVIGKTSTDWMLIQMDLGTGDTIQHNIKNLLRINIQEFEVTDGAAIIGGYYNTDPVVIHFDMSSGKTKVLPGIFGNKTELVQVKVMDDNSITVLVSDRTYDRRNTLAVKTYDNDGKYLNNHVFEPDLDKGLIFGRVADVPGVGNLVSGTYGGKRSDYSRGLFIGNAGVARKDAIKYYNYADFDNFFNYMKAKRQKRVANKITRKKVKGKKTKFNYRLIVHEILKDNDTYIMLGEAFYPKYSNTGSFSSMNSFYDRPSYGGFGRNKQVSANFAGYRYTHAVVIGFDREGNMLWDNSFQIEDVTSFTLKQFVQADITENGLVLLYLYDDEVRSKIIRGSEVIEGKSMSQVKLTFLDDAISNTSASSIGGLEKWYDDQFLAYGIQKIKNLKDAGVKMNRRVFYLNKIEYKPSDEDIEAVNDIN